MVVNMVVDWAEDVLRASVSSPLDQPANFVFYFDGIEVRVWTTVMGLDAREIEDLVYFRLDTLRDR